MDYPKLLKILSGLRETKPNATVLLCGVYGSGKSTIANTLKSDLPFIQIISASKLIKHDSLGKEAHDVSANQQKLVESFFEAKSSDNLTLLDGHCCVINNLQEIEFVGIDIFQKISPDIIILAENPSVIIFKRLNDRGLMQYSKSLIGKLIVEEKSKAKEVADTLNIPIYRI